MRISLTHRGLYEQQWCTLSESTINLAQKYTRRRVLQNVSGHPSHTHLVADGTDVIVLLELLVRSCRQALDLLTASLRSRKLCQPSWALSHTYSKNGWVRWWPITVHSPNTVSDTPYATTHSATRNSSSLYVPFTSRWHHPCSPPELCGAPPPWRARRSAACPAPKSQRV